MPSSGEEAEETSGREPLPWSVKVLGIAFGAYLILRLIQLAAQLIRWAAGG